MGANPSGLDERPVHNRDDLSAPFWQGIKLSAQARIGPEIEKFAVFAESGLPLPYAGPVSILTVFHALKTFGWKDECEFERGPTIALRRGDSAITLEPGGQLELSGSPQENLHQVAREIADHLDELAPSSRDMGVRWLGVGFHPTARRQDFDWVPKLRYPIMRDYFEFSGRMGQDMMLRTATVQVNLDFFGEADAMRRLRFALRLSPVVAAMFSNSPWVEGRVSEGMSHRGKVWMEVDPARVTAVRPLWNAATFAEYVDWALDVPMFLVRRGSLAIPAAGATFRQLMAGDIPGLCATHADWVTHLNTLFPDARLRATLEMRCADAQGPALTIALPSLWTGLLYDARAFAAAERLCEDWSYDEVLDLRGRVWHAGLKTEFRRRPLREWAERIVDIAKGGLARRAVPGVRAADESVHLLRLERLVGNGVTPAEAAVSEWTGLRRGPSGLLDVLDLQHREVGASRPGVEPTLHQRLGMGLR
jgi:glutamate--cysteine ligase